MGYTGDNGPAAGAQLNYPWAVAVDSAGNLYIADTYNQCIRKVSNGVITTVAGNGTPGYGGDNGPATSAQLYDPFGVAVDSAGNLYIADTGNASIRKVESGVIATVAGNGTAGYTGDGGPAASAELDYPSDGAAALRPGLPGERSGPVPGRRQDLDAGTGGLPGPELEYPGDSGGRGGAGHLHAE